MGKFYTKTDFSMTQLIFQVFDSSPKPFDRVSLKASCLWILIGNYLWPKSVFIINIWTPKGEKKILTRAFWKVISFCNFSFLSKAPPCLCYLTSSRYGFLVFSYQVNRSTSLSLSSMSLSNLYLKLTKYLTNLTVSLVYFIKYYFS